MQLSARGAQKTRNEAKKLNMYSKQWLPGDTLRVFYPIYWENGKPEIAVGAVWGHNVSDIKELGLKTAFIPSTTDFDENGQPVGQPDITYQFSQIARVFVNGQQKKEEAAIMQKPWPTESARKDALKQVEEKFDAKNNKKAVRPLIGRPQFYISTEVLSIKIANGIPNPETIALSSAPLSNQTINKIYGLMDDPKYAPAEGDEFFEVEWKYTAGAEKDEAGRTATCNGLTGEYRMLNQFPEAYNQVMGQKGMVARDAESIVRRATRTIDPVKVKQALTRYAFMKCEYLDLAVDEDEETLLKHANVLKELDITRALTPGTELVAKIQQAIAELDATHVNVPVDVPTPSIAEAQPAQAEATPVMSSAPVEPQPQVSMPTPTPVVPDIPINPEAPNLSALVGGNVQNLMNNANNAGIASDGGDDVNFAPSMI